MKKPRWLFTFVLFVIINQILSCSTTPKNQNQKISVGFDIDDTLLFSTPAFNKARESFQFGTDEFWSLVNSLDEEYSPIKKKVYEIVKQHLQSGNKIYAITARPGNNGNALKRTINKKFGIPVENVYFEPNQKIDKIKQLGITLFYGDSDSDIQDAIAAGAKGIRIERSPKSSYKDEKTGKLIKYNPGKFGEEIIYGSEE